MYKSNPVYIPVKTKSTKKYAVKVNILGDSTAEALRHVLKRRFPLADYTVQSFLMLDGDRVVQNSVKAAPSRVCKPLCPKSLKEDDEILSMLPCKGSDDDQSLSSDSYRSSLSSFPEVSRPHSDQKPLSRSRSCVSTVSVIYRSSSIASLPNIERSDCVEQVWSGLAPVSWRSAKAEAKVKESGEDQAVIDSDPDIVVEEEEEE